MTIWYIVIFVVGTILGVVFPRSPIRTQRSQPKTKCHLDDVDNMVLWGEVTGDSFYKGE